MKKSAKRAVMQPKYRIRVVKAKKGKGSYQRKLKHLKNRDVFSDVFAYRNLLSSCIKHSNKKLGFCCE